jgi:hypothetical protein
LAAAIVVLAAAVYVALVRPLLSSSRTPSDGNGGDRTVPTSATSTQGAAASGAQPFDGAMPVGDLGIGWVVANVRA